MDSLAHKFTNRAYDWILTFGLKIIIALTVFVIGPMGDPDVNRWFKKIISNDRFEMTLRPFCKIFLPSYYRLC